MMMVGPWWLRGGFAETKLRVNCTARAHAAVTPLLHWLACFVLFPERPDMQAGGSGQRQAFKT